MNTSNTKPAKKNKAYLQIRFKNNPNPKGFKTDNLGKGLTRLEQYLQTVQGKWDWALLRQANTGNIIYYYHPNTGTQRLDLDGYKEQLTCYSLYIIPTLAYKKQHDNVKGISKRVYSLENIEQYWNQHVLRIDIYQDGKLVNQYERGKFLK